MQPRSTDPTLVQQNRIEASDYATVRAADTSNGYAGKTTPFTTGTSNGHTRKIAPFAAIAKRTVTVEVTGVVRSSHNPFELRWTERNTGFPGIVVRRPHDVETPRGNPHGIHMHGLNRSRDL